MSSGLLRLVESEHIRGTNAGCTSRDRSKRFGLVLFRRKGRELDAMIPRMSPLNIPFPYFHFVRGMGVKRWWTL